MLTHHELHTNRHPRPVVRHPRSPITDTNKFSCAMAEMRPLLLKMARRISRPYYIDAEDLVQEAMLKIFRTRSKYRSDKNTSLKTWIMHVAMKQFYNVATTEYRQKRVPQGMHVSKAFTNIADMEELSNYKSLYNCFSPHSCETEYNIRYKEIIKRTETRLRPFAKQVFHALLEPPEKLIDIIKKNQEDRARAKLFGESTKVPFQFRITAEQLSEHFSVPKHRISQAKDSINDAMVRAFED